MQSEASSAAADEVSTPEYVLDDPAEALSLEEEEARAAPGSRLSNPMLLGREKGPFLWSSTSTSAFLMVKNTFIQGFTEEAPDSDEDGGGPSVVAWKSCPTEPLAAGPLEAANRRDRRRVRTVHYFQMGSGLVENSVDEQECNQSDKLEHSIATAADDCTASPAGQMSGQEPLEGRVPQLSIGSVLHDAGDCKPCAWFWRPQGCENGEGCRHCHLCPPGEVKARRRHKMASMRRQSREDREEVHSVAVPAPALPSGATVGARRGPFIELMQLV